MNLVPAAAKLAEIARPRLLGAIVCALVVLGASASVFATTVLKLDLESLVANSDQIVEAEVVEVNSRVEHGKVYTYTELRVEDGLKGAGKGETITVKQIGGRTDELTTMVPGIPHFQKDERVVVFLEKPKADASPVVTGMSQGKFSVARGPDNVTPYVVPYLGNLALIEPLEPDTDEAIEIGEAMGQASGEGNYRPGKPAQLYERVVPLDVFKQEVREVIRGQEAR
jgi:hypothetical protein